MNHESSTIVRLAPGPNATNITFEEAFGEWSEARGRGRAKRTARKAAKQQDKLERKTNRVQSRDAKKRVKSETRQVRRSDKKQNRQDLRLGRRSNRKVQRQDMRDEQQQSRQGRRDESKLRRVARKGFGREEYEDPNLDSNYQQDDQGYEENYDDGYDDNYQDGYNDSYDQGYDDSYDQGYDDSYEENYDQGYEDDYGYDEEPDYDADYDDYYDYQPEWEGDFGNFDGESKANDAFMVETDESVIVPKNVLETAVKIEWNKELIEQLQTKGKQLVNAKTDDTAVKQALKERLSRLKDLCDAEALFSSASGENSKVAYKAKRIAKAKRAEASPSYRTSKYNRKTKVQRGIGAQISPNRIEVNAKETNSSFAGAKSVDWKPIALGVGIGVASIVLLKLTKVIK